jgi:hypothetical protein
MYNRTHEQRNDSLFKLEIENMTTTTKNYTKEQEAKMMADYSIEPTRSTVNDLSDDLGKSSKSIIAKLVSLGVYKKMVKLTKTGKAVVRKTELVAKINEHYGFEMPSLVKATKDDLQNLVDNLN